jgi:hypothetical protein
METYNSKSIATDKFGKTLINRDDAIKRLRKYIGIGESIINDHSNEHRAKDSLKAI